MWTKQIGQDNENMTTKTGECGQKGWVKEGLGRKAWAGRPGQDNRSRQLGWYRQDKKERTGWKDKVAGTGHLGLDNHGRSAIIVKWGHGN